MVHLLDDLIIIALCHGETPIQGAVVQQVLYNIGLEGTENVAGAEVDPEGILLGGCLDLLVIEGGELIACLLPCASVL